MNLEELKKKVHLIRVNSEWGETQTLESCIMYIKAELDELTSALLYDSAKNSVNVHEEYGDVVMMLLFLDELLKENGVDTYSSIELANKKLTNRYPELLGTDCFQYTLPGFEQATYYKQKRSGKIDINYCYCRNEQCTEYCAPFSKHLDIVDEMSFYCHKCHKNTSVKKGYLFYGLDDDKVSLLNIIYDYVVNHQQNINILSTKYKVSISTTQMWLKRCFQSINYLANLLNRQNGVDKANVIKSLQDRKNGDK